MHIGILLASVIREHIISFLHYRKKTESICKTKDFKSFTSPKRLNPKSNMSQNDIGRMIDPFIIKYRDEYNLFFKQNGVSLSKSKDFITWEFKGSANGGENACVIKRDDHFILTHSPENGISFSKSYNLEEWEQFNLTFLNQNEWEWAKGRITAGFVMETYNNDRYKYVMFFHGSKNVYPETHGNATLAFVYTNDFVNFEY